MSRRSASTVAARLLALAAGLVVTRPLAAQDFAFSPRVQPELRAELAVARHASALALAGVNVPLGYYVRAGLSAGAGVTDVHGHQALALRSDAVVRFLLDPFAQTAWGPYAGGGLTARRDGADQPRAGLLLVLGVEGHRGRRWVPAVELALGEGARLAVVLRKARKNGR